MIQQQGIKFQDDELSDQELHLYSRHILLEDWDIEAQQRLRQSRVLMIGAGGIGCTAGELLVRAGVGHLTIIDFDQVELSNIQRQIAFFPEDVGQSKVQMLVQHLQHINPFVDIRAIEDRFDAESVAQIGTGFDLVLDGCDNFATRYVVNRFCIQHRIALLSAAAIALQGQLMLLKGQPCYQCVFPEQQETDERRCANSGVLTTTPVLMADRKSVV